MTRPLTERLRACYTAIGSSQRSLRDSINYHARLRSEAADALEAARDALRDFCDLCPRMNDDDPIAPALRETCDIARAVLAHLEGAGS